MFMQVYLTIMIISFFAMFIGLGLCLWDLWEFGFPLLIAFPIEIFGFIIIVLLDSIWKWGLLLL